MSDFVGTRSCMAFQEALHDPELEAAAGTLNLAAHTIMGSYTDRGIEAGYNDEQKRWAAVSGLLIRSSAVDMVDATFAADQGVYEALLITVEKHCDGNCSDCTFAGVDLTKK